MDSSKNKVQREARIRVLNKNARFSYEQRNVLILPVNQGYELLKFENILYCEADSNYVNIHTMNGRKITFSKTLKWVQERLNQFFFRTHQSYLINMLHVEFYNVPESYLKIVGGVQVPVSRSMKKEVGSFFRSQS